MSLRILSAGLLLLTVVVVSGCHSQSRYGAGYCQPNTVVAGSPCPTPCNTCGTAPPAGMITAVPGH